MDGIRAGMTVKDATGKRLGKIQRIYPWGFEVVRGFWSPYQWVFRHHEVRRVADGTVEVARAQDDLQRLAAGGVPASWIEVRSPFGDGSILGAPGEARAAEAARGPRR